MSLLNSVEAWIAIGISGLFIVAALVMHRVFVKVLKADPQEAPPHE